MPGGAIIGNVFRWTDDQIRWSTGLVEMTDKQREQIIATGYLRKGVPYSFLDYGALAAHRFHIPTPRLKRYIASSHHEICSQLVDSVFAFCGVHLFKDGRWPGYVTPGSLSMLLDEIETYNLSQGI
jgi:hypothetical protein